jgi:hypothetical protein
VLGYGAGGKGRCPWLCKQAPLSRTGADGPQAEKRAIAADTHRIARVPCDNFLYFVFLAEALKKNTVCPVEKKIVSIRSALLDKLVEPHHATMRFLFFVIHFLSIVRKKQN